jgi:mitogen-activated protein kinase kinase kinase 7
MLKADTMTKWLRAAATVVGSRDTVDLTMTAGVGTPYWTALEILEGKRYTEQADVYSFGVVLTELDTGRIPYADAVTKDGVKLKPFQILNSVMTDQLRPSFSKGCPPRIQRVGMACLAHLPASRPTAQQLVREPEGTDEYDGCSF